jgi:hypothetical protein
MRRSSHLRPARTVAVALLAMLIGMAGTGIASTALAKTGSHKSAKSKKKKKKTTVLVRCAATTVTCKGHAGATGPTGPAGLNGAAGAPGTALGYAKVTAAGVVVAGTTKNITTVNVTKVGLAGFCFTGLPFTPGTASVNVAYGGSPSDAFAQVELPSGDSTFTLDTGCPVAAQAFVWTVNGSTATPEPFYVSFS